MVGHKISRNLCHIPIQLHPEEKLSDFDKYAHIKVQLNELKVTCQILKKSKSIKFFHNVLLKLFYQSDNKEVTKYKQQFMLKYLHLKRKHMKKT